MSARTKLNMVNMNAALLIGAVLGAITESWLVFFLTTGAMIVGDFHSGDIRLGGGKSLRR
jgi:hypothetical protein